jgi:hypothetical protein
MATCALFGRNLLNELIAYIILPERRREEERKYISDPDSGAISLSMDGKASISKADFQAQSIRSSPQNITSSPSPGK